MKLLEGLPVRWSIFLGRKEGMLMTVVALTVTQIVPSLAPAFSGPVTVGSSGAAVPRSALTIGYPAQGVTYDVPLLAASQTHYSVDRPHKHT